MVTLTREELAFKYLEQLPYPPYPVQEQALFAWFGMRLEGAFAPVGTEVTAEGLSLIVTQVLRFVAIAAVGFPVAYAIAPGDLGPALRQLHLGDRMVRFIPTLSEEFGETIDAQRVRGFDPLQRGGGPLARLRRLAPVFVPVTVGSLAGAEW